MDRDVNVKTTLIVILSFIGLIASWAYFNTKSLSADSPSFIKTNPIGNVVVNLGDDFYEVTVDGIDTQNFSALDVGLDKTRGDFDFFSNGDVLIYSSSYTPSLQDNLKAFARMNESENRAPESGEGFYRCVFSGSECSVFSTNLPTFNRGFRLTIDENDNVYISDTSRHRILKVSSNGELIATLDKDLNFPNDIYWENNVLWFVNTNNHEVTSIEVNSEGFGEPLKSFKPNIPGAQFPTDFTKFENGWYVLSMDGAMANGKLAKFNVSGELLDVVDVERGADLIGVIKAGDQLIIPDMKHLRYRAINIHDNKEQEDFSSALIAKHLKESRSIVNKNDRLAWLVIVIGIIAFLILAYVAIKSEVKAINSDVQHYEDNTDSEVDMPEGVQEYWIPESKQFLMIKKTTRWLFPLGALVVIIGCIFILFEFEKFHVLLIPMGMCMAIFYFSWRMLKNFSNVGIGISGSLIMVRSHEKKTTVGKNSEISFSSSALCIGDAVIPIKLFDIDEMERWVKPRLKSATQLSEVQMIAKQWKLRHPILIEPIKMCAAMLVAITLMEVLN
ncbi:MAG: hypothetical protein ACI9T7_001885 [Oleiphilaceae bacterium]|jgi:hypothetical protein